MLPFAGSLEDKLIYNLNTVTVGYFSPQEVVLPYPGYSMYTHLITYYRKLIHEYITYIIMVVLEVESYWYHNCLLHSNLKFVYVLYFS